jgi:pilus assembly protein CpaC
MKPILSVCTMLAMSTMAYGQQPSVDSHAVGAGTQVVMRLQIAEVSLTKLQRLGFDLARIASDSDAKPNIDSASFNAQWSAITKDGTKAKLLLDALRKDNLAKILAEPTLVTMSGKTANFNSGGELSVPKPQPDGSVTMERQNGTMVQLTPEVLGDRVRLTIHGRLSELDYGNMMRVGKEDVPGVHTREFSTRTELESGQTLAISGLTQVRVEAIAHGLPYISEIPYAGAILRSVKEERNEVALLILVRPEIVQTLTTASRADAAGPQGGVPVPQTPRPIGDPQYAPHATVYRAADGDIRR